MTVAAFVPDLMDRSRLGGRGWRFVAGPAEVADGEEVVVDLDRARLEDWAPLAATHRVTGFGSHVAADRLDAARAAGFVEVLTRSVFFRRPSGDPP